MTCVTEPQKRIPVRSDVDVVVAGAGVAGVFAALGAARAGARTALVERFGNVGGNIGPGMIVNGHMISGRACPEVRYECTVYPQLCGLGREFLDRYAELGGGSLPPVKETFYAWDASIASYVAQTMLEESGVELLVGTMVADPVLDGHTVRGVYIETKSGREAVTARVTVDATGDADLARRAGAGVLHPRNEYHELDGHAPTGMGISYLVGGVDWPAFNQAKSNHRPARKDLEWGAAVLGDRAAGMGLLLPALRQAVETDGYEPNPTVELDGVPVEFDTGALSPLPAPGIAQGSGKVGRVETVDTGNGAHMAALETHLRRRIFEHVMMYRRYVPGFEQACLLAVAPFLGSRGGPCIEGAYTLTMADCRAGRRFDDVLYLYGEFRALRYTAAQGRPLWVDMPYRVMLPKGLEGLLAVGRSASGIPDTLLRNRMGCKVMGQAGGTAAALAAARDETPRQLDVRGLQERLLEDGFYLGDRFRLRELGLV